MRDQLAPGFPVTLHQNLTATEKLLYERRDRIHRHVQATQFRDDFSAVLRISLYMTLPAETYHGELAVPMAFCEKRRLYDFSLRNEADKALPMLTVPQGAQVTAQILAAIARRGQGAPVPDEASKRLEEITQTSDSFRAALTTDQQPWLSERLRSPEFRQILHNASQYFIMYAVLQDACPGDRRVLKYSYQSVFRLDHTRQGMLANLAAWFGIAPTAISLDSPTGLAESVHVEIEAPVGIIAESGTLERFANPAGSRSVELEPRPEGSNGDDLLQPSTPGYGKRLHFHVRAPYEPTEGAKTHRVRKSKRRPSEYSEEPPRELTAWIFLRVRRGGWVFYATATSFLVALSLQFVSDREQFLDDNTVRQATASVLLAVAGLVAAFFSRPSHHAVTAKVLFVPRMLVGLSALAAYAKSFDLLVFPNDELPNVSTGYIAEWLAWASFGFLALFWLGPVLYRIPAFLYDIVSLRGALSIDWKKLRRGMGRAVKSLTRRRKARR